MSAPISWRHWLEAARPKTLPAAIIPVMVGTALAVAHHSDNYASAGICLAFALLVQIGTNFANDYFDFVKGADTAERIGPRRAVAAGLIAPKTMLAATCVVLGAAFLVGLLLVRSGGWVLLPIGIVSIVCAIAYTGGPFPLGYHGLGDLFVFIFFGLVAVCATFYVQVGLVTPDVVSCAAAVGLLAANIIVPNNYRDMETDARAGKKTLVVRFGRRFCRLAVCAVRHGRAAVSAGAVADGLPLAGAAAGNPVPVGLQPDAPLGPVMRAGGADCDPGQYGEVFGGLWRAAECRRRFR